MKIPTLTTDDIKAEIERAVAKMLESQPDIFRFTSQTGQTEWNLAHHLAVELQKLFTGYSCDLDVTKRFHIENARDEYRRPDIIFHRRTVYDHDDLVIEVKFNGHPNEIQEDIKKIHEYWFPPLLSYKFGAIVNLFTDKPAEIQVFANPTYTAPQNALAAVPQA